MQTSLGGGGGGGGMIKNNPKIVHFFNGQIQIQLNIFKILENVYNKQY